MAFDVDLVGAVSGDINRLRAELMVMSHHTDDVLVHELVKTNAGFLSQILEQVFSEYVEADSEVGVVADSVWWLLLSTKSCLSLKPLLKRLASCSCGSA